MWGALTGIYAAVAAFTLGEALRTAWLHRRSRVPWMARTLAEDLGLSRAFSGLSRRRERRSRSRRSVA